MSSTQSNLAKYEMLNLASLNNDILIKLICSIKNDYENKIQAMEYNININRLRDTAFTWMDICDDDEGLWNYINTYAEQCDINDINDIKAVFDDIQECNCYFCLETNTIKYYDDTTDVMEAEEEDKHKCGHFGGIISGMEGCGKFFDMEDTNMIHNTSFCIACYEKFEEQGN
tara:strand:+ start:629 stop:1144 length:516 start_codon:yes stop_codon:yes gene_type:complete